MRTFVRLKYRLVVNAIVRRRTTWGMVSFVLYLTAAVSAALLGLVGLALGLRYGWGDEARHRMLILVTTGIVAGWWFAPLVTGGVDETIDPRRLALLPLSRRDIRRGQIAAGFVGVSPLMVVAWVLGLVLGSIGGLSTVPMLLLVGAVVLLAALVGSRSLSTTLARWSRTRRGGDVATLVAVLLGSALFAGSQLLRFLDNDDLDAAAAVVRWTPPGMAGEAFELAGAGHELAALWRVGVLAAVTVVAGWWWSRQLDRLLTEPDDVRGERLRDRQTGGLAIFAGAIRRRLPATPGGAAVAKELVYLVRSPARRASLLGGTVLGLVYVVFFVAAMSGPDLVLAAPVSMLLALQYGSNQLGVDPGAFWIEVAAGPPARARWAGRQFLGVVAVMLPVVVAATSLAAWTGGWVELGVVMVVMAASSASLVGIGSVISPMLVTPLPDNGNPFGGRQAMQGTGCTAAVVGLVYVVLLGVLVVPAELALRWAWRDSHPLVAVGVVVAVVAANAAIWRWSTAVAARQLPERELEVLARLDPRLNV